MSTFMKQLVCSLTIITVGGCANISNGSHQTLYVDAGNHANCQISRDDGLNLAVRSLENFTLDRSSSPLNIACQNGEDAIEVKQDSDFAERFLLLDIATDFCLVSCWIDSSKKAWYEYPNPIVVDIKHHL